MCKDIIMCKETEKLIKILQGSQNPTDMALIILANKMDDINKKLDTGMTELRVEMKRQVDELSIETKKQIEEIRQATLFAKWMGLHKKLLIALSTVLIILSVFGLSGLVSWIKNKFGI